MSNPKEKAIELIDKFYPYVRWKMGQEGVTERAKQCALIAVDEIIMSAPFEPAKTDWDEAGSSAQYWYPQKLEDSSKWWSEVKQEIEKL